MKLVLVTGGAGYIGVHVCHELRQAGYIPVIIDDLSTGSRELAEKVAYSGFNRLFVDVTNRSVIEEEMSYWASAPEAEIHAVVHLAAKTSVPEGESKPYEYYNTNALGTLNVARVCTKLKIPVLIYASTAAVYGPCSSPCVEWQEPRPSNVYGDSKLLGERFIQQHYSGRSVIFRFFNVAGANTVAGIGDTRVDSTALIPNIVRSGRTGKVFTVYGDGGAVRDFVHVSDLARAITLAVVSNSARGIFNIGGSRSATVAEVVDTTRQIVPKLLVQHAAQRAGDVKISTADISKLQRVLMFRPGLTLRDMLTSEYDWQCHFHR